MLKWVGRILYVVFVFIIISTIELGSGGVQGLQRGDYAVDYVIPSKDDNGDYDPHKALARFTAAIDIYYSNQAIASFSSVGDATVDDQYEVGFELYPFVSLMKHSEINIWFDGFFFILTDYNEDAINYRIEVSAVNNSIEDAELITLTNDDLSRSGMIYLLPDDFFLNSRPALVTYIENSSFYGKDKDAKTATSFEYDIVSISMYATFLKNEEGETEEKFIYRITDHSESFAGTPIKEDTTQLDVKAEDYNLSKLIGAGAPSDEEVETYSLVTTYHPADFSKYVYWYWIIYGGYTVLILVIPYFWFFHRRVMAKFRSKKELKEKEDFANQKLQDGKPIPQNEQIFSDVEPKGDD